MPNRSALIRRIRHWIANRGLKGFLLEVWYRLKLLAQGKPVSGRAHADTGPHPFDLAHNVDTTGLVWGESLPSTVDKHAQYWATGYYGIGPSAFAAALDRLALDWPTVTFVDIGCGKGRALLLALRHPFRRVLGVELSPALVAVANANLQTFTAPWRQPHVPAEAIAGDATTFPLPDGPLLLFLYHPFAGPVMKRFLAHLQAGAQPENTPGAQPENTPGVSTETRDIYLLYANPELGKDIAATPGFTQLWRDYIPLSPEDAAADRFGSQGEYFAAYQLHS